MHFRNIIFLSMRNIKIKIFIIYVNIIIVNSEKLILLVKLAFPPSKVKIDHTKVTYHSVQMNNVFNNCPQLMFSVI